MEQKDVDHSNYNGGDDEFEWMGDVSKEELEAIDVTNDKLLKSERNNNSSTIEQMDQPCDEDATAHNLSKKQTNSNQQREKRAHRKKKTSFNNRADLTMSNNNNCGIYSEKLAMKLKWAVDELTKSNQPNRIAALCTVITKLTESIKALKQLEMTNDLL
ncbi:unnamed protein product [Didymodactylos carnosus]|uniref:Uncharacterized protein n=2 Tax=Didymodactylos carnosus TaxID=1234261 RepID=A0A8S2DMH0_9BILA|nr:unnamed protein product [Didymodactylos carnosus]CAF3730441.1 unnamed protein product [Didymodactylos carnosus]